MGVYKRLKRLRPKQSCIVCTEPSKYVVCQSCEDDFIVQETRCLSCAIPLKQSLDYCGNCLRTSNSFHRAFTIYDYNNVVAYLIKKMKYDARLSITRFFATKMTEKLNQMKLSGHTYDVFIPMPLHKKRLFERGYNQVVEIIRGFAKKNLIDTTSLQRIKQTAPLADLSLAQREKEIKGAFNLTRKITHKKVLHSR